MKNLKKTLSMVLVIAMMVGILVTGAGAAFTDQDDINYATAVEVMTGIGAINGYTDGTFKPLDTITRQEAAKMVAYAALTPAVAKMLKTTTSSFTDVKATDWASPFIEYCVSKGILNGKGDNKFDPTGNVTGYELGKMLLCAAGYGKLGEYTGAQWDLNVAIDAIDKGIYTGTLDTDLSDAATREEAALYVFNAITKIDQVVFNTTTNAYQLTTTAGITIGEQKYGLAFTPKSVNGVDGYVWTNGAGKELSTFVALENVIGTSTNGTSIGLLTTYTSTNTKYIAALDTAPVYVLNGKTITVATFTAGTAYAADTYILINGELYKINAVAIATTDDAAAAIAKCTEINVSGVIVNLINSDGDAKAEKVSLVKKSVGAAAAAPYVNATTGSVTILGLAGSPFAKDTVTYPADLAAGDVVLYYTDLYNVTHIEKADKVTGQMTASNSGLKNITFGGAVYYQSGLVTDVLFTGATPFVATANYNVDATAYVDDNGDIIAIAANAVAPVAKVYGVVVDYSYNAGSGTLGSLTYVPASAKVRIIKEDGTIGVYDVAVGAGGVVPNQSAANVFGFTGAPYGLLASYVINDAGKITLTPATLTGTATLAAASPLVTIGAANYYATSATKVFYYNGADAYAVTKTASVSTGYAKLAAGAGVSVSYVLVPGSTTQLAAIYISAAPAATTVAGNYGYVVTPGVSTHYALIGGVSTALYDYTVYVNGTATTLTSKSAGYFGAAGLYTYTKDADGYIVDTTQLSGNVTAPGTVTIKEDNFIAYTDGSGNQSIGINASTAFYVVSAFTGVTAQPIAASTPYVTYSIVAIQPSLTPGVAAAIYFTVA